MALQYLGELNPRLKFIGETYEAPKDSPAPRIPQVGNSNISESNVANLMFVGEGPAPEVGPYAETKMPESVGDFVTRVLPESAGKTALAFGTMLPETVGAIVGPVARAIVAPDPETTVESTAKDTGKGVVEVGKGMLHFMGRPIGAFGLDEAKKAWATDPVGSAAAILGIKKGGQAVAERTASRSLKGVENVLEPVQEIRTPAPKLRFVSEGEPPKAQVYEFQPKTETTGNLKQSVIEGASEAETFGLLPSKGEIGTPAPKGATQKTVDWTREVVNENPIFKAVEDMKKNGGLNRDSLLRDYDVDTVAEISKRNPGLVRKDGGFGYDDMAAQMGYESGDSLVNSLIEKPTKKAAMKAVRDEFAASPMGQKAEIARRGFTPLDEPITAGKLRKGDQVLIDGEKYRVTKETGEGVTLEDGKTIKADPFDQINAEGIKEKSAGKTVTESVRSKEQRGSFSLKSVEPERTTYKFENPDIESRWQNAEPKQDTLAQKTRDYLTSLWHKASRSYEHLPRNAEFAELQFGLKRLEKQRGVAQDRSIRTISNVLGALKDKESYSLFTRKVILDDLAHEVSRGRQLPFGFTPETLAIETAKLDAEISRHPHIADAIEKRRMAWGDLRQEYVEAMRDIGINLEHRFSNEAYFRHDVLDYINQGGIFGTGKKLQVPSNRSFLKKREGSAMDINRDYLEPEYRVMSQMMYDIEVARTIKLVEEKYDIAKRVRAEAKVSGLDDWHKAIPEGYTTWQPKEGNLFYRVLSVPEKLAEKLMEGAFEDILPEEVKVSEVTALGRKRREYVVKNEVAETLNNLQKTSKANILANLDRKALTAWKQWQLISPRRMFKYNFRNLTGDADAAFVGNPETFKKSKAAAQDLWDYYIEKKEMSADLKDWFDRGGFESTLQAAEMGELKKLWTFERLYRENKKLGDVPAETWKGYWKAARLSTDFREALLRYASYKDYLEQMKADPNGKPKNFGGSVPDEIMGLSDIKDRAFWLSNDLLGAYDRVGVAGNILRQYWYPFWSWKEVNFRRYVQFAKNAASDGKLAEAIGRRALGTAVRSPLIAARIGGFMIKATAFWSALQAWNYTMYPELENQLSNEERARPHIIFGKNDKGEIVYFNRMGALGDFLQWFGLDAAPKNVEDWLSGRKNLKEIAADMAKSPVNVVVQGLTPTIKQPVEVALRRQTFPDVFRPRTIRDRGLYLAESLGLGEEYKNLMGLPHKPYSETAKNIFVYQSDPGQAAYSDIYEQKQSFLRKLGKGSEGFWVTPKGLALYNYKLAVKYQDKQAAQKYLLEYVTKGGDANGLRASIQAMHPLAGMNKQEQQAFMQTLNKDDKRRMAQAIQFYETTLQGRK